MLNTHQKIDEHLCLLNSTDMVHWVHKDQYLTNQPAIFFEREICKKSNLQPLEILKLTRKPDSLSASANCVLIVDFPTPPLPESTNKTCLTPSNITKRNTQTPPAM